MKQEKRHVYVVELDAPVQYRHDASRTEKADVLRKAFATAKDQFLNRMEPKLREHDPAIVLDVERDSIFPLMYVKTVRTVRGLLRQDPQVKSVYRARRIGIPLTS